jgi:peptide/nickel transport system substrate-binding protein
VAHRSTDTSRPALLRLLAILAALALVAAACGGDDDDGGDPGATPGNGDDTEEELGEPQYGGTVTMGLEAETNEWVPGRYAGANAGSNIQRALFDPLVQQTADGDMEPYLAESLESNDDLTEWTLTLREGVEFHDGTPLDAEAIRFNFDELLKAEGANTLGALADVESFEVTGELTGVYRLTVPNAAFPDLLTGTIGMPFSPAAIEQFGEDAGSNPVGTGPFVFENWRRDSELTVVRNENYWQTDADGNQLPYLDRIVFRPIPDEDTRLASLRSGEVNAMHSLRQSIVRQAREIDDINRHEFLGNNGGGAIFNTTVAPVDDQRVRLGLAYAITQDDLIAVLGGEGITPIQTQYFTPDSPWYSEDVAEAWPDDDPDRAQELLDEYVNDPDRSDGKAVGDPIAVEFNCPPDPSLIELAQLYQAFWGAVGVDVSLNQVEQSAHISNGIAGDYMINCWRMGDQGDPYNTLNSAHGPVEERPLNFTRFHDDLIAENLEILRTSDDFNERYDAVEAIMMHFTEQVPNLWTGGTAMVVAAAPEVKNMDQWQLPNGSRGNGVASAVVKWAHVWIDS